MENGNNTPFWLELKKEYIDDNFEKLLPYLKENAGAVSAKRDSFYQTTLSLMEKRVKELLSVKANVTIYEDERAVRNRMFDIRLLAAYLLAQCGSPILQKTVHVALFAELARVANGKFSTSLLAAGLRRLKADKVMGVGFTWDDILSPDISLDIFAYKAVNNLQLSLTKTDVFWYEHKGVVRLDAKGLHLIDKTREDSNKAIQQQSGSLAIGDPSTGSGQADSLEAVTDKKDQLKMSEADSVTAMQDFTDDFVERVQKATKKTKVLKRYGEGDRVDVKVVELVGRTIIVETTDKDHEKMRGPLENMKSLLYYYTDSFADIFHVGDRFDVDVKDADRPTFTIDKSFVEYIVDERAGDQCIGEEVVCKLIDTHKGKDVWLTDYGVAVYSNEDSDYCIGDYALLRITRRGQGKQFGMIYAEVLERTIGGDYDESSIRYDCVRGYVYKKDDEEQEVKLASSAMPRELIGILLRQMFYHQKLLMKPSERYRHLCLSRLMAEMIDDKIAASYIDYNAQYLRVLVQFASGENVKAQLSMPEGIDPSAPSVLERQAVVQLLSEYGNSETSASLDDAAQSHPIPLLQKLARLVQSANRMTNFIEGGTLNVLRREVIKTLSLETEQDTDLEADNGIYLGVESGTQEFKSSFVYPPDNNQQPEPSTQRHNVFKAVCAFLNSSTGGTLYLGVNDAGYVRGLDEDFKYLGVYSMDSYTRYIQDAAKKDFGLDVLTHLTITPIYDDKVVAIKVEPYEYRVVSLNDVAYIRVNNESRIMTEGVRQQLLERKVFRNREKVANTGALQQAIESKRRVILHGYASSNSGVVTDRNVEAYEVFPMHNLVACFDLKDMKNKVFSISRIGNVEITEDAWAHQLQHKKVEVDVFHMTGAESFPVSLQLDLLAKNLLVEEFPASKNYLKPHKGDDNIWYFDTKVFNIYGLGRFYLGLANHIKILNCPQLKDFAKDFANKHLL